MAKLRENSNKIKRISLNFSIIFLLIFFFPVGLFLMWKYTDWSKKTKWIVTGIIASIIIIGIFGSYNSAPIITVMNSKDKRISTDGATYELTGDVSSMKTATLIINDKSITMLKSSNKFYYKAALVEGDNSFEIEATNENGKTKETFIIHRATQAEITARAEAQRLSLENKAKETTSKAEINAKSDAEKKAETEAQAKKQAELAAQAKASAEAKAAAEAKAKADAQAQHAAYIDGLATTYCSKHSGWRSIYVPLSSSRDEWENLNKDMVTKYPSQSDCVIIMTFFVDTMPSDNITSITNAKVGTGMNIAEVLAAWGWPDNNSNYSSSWGSSGTWTWNTGTCYYGVCPHQQYVTFYNGKVSGTGNY